MNDTGVPYPIGSDRKHKIRPIVIGLGMLWALPLTFIGVVLFALPILLSGGSSRRVQGVLPGWLVQGRFGDLLLRNHPVGAVNAMAIGHLVVAERGMINQRILRHEMEHVRQAACWGVLFPLAYLVASAVALLRGGEAYWDNRFEVDARKAEVME